MTQAKLVAALQENDQSSVGSCLQIFFNLQSLPLIILDIIDSSVRDAVDFSKRTINLESIAESFPELFGGSGSRGGRGGGSRTAAALAVVASMGHNREGKESSSSSGSGGGNRDRDSGGSSKSKEVLLRASLRETAALWTEGMNGFTASIRTLELVVSKKKRMLLPARDSRTALHVTAKAYKPEQICNTCGLVSCWHSSLAA